MDGPQRGGLVTLDDLEAIGRADPHRARDVLAAFPKQCRHAMHLYAEPAASLRRPPLVVVVGMGGSGASGDLLAACAAERLDVPILVHRGYGLPAAVGPETLVIAASYSGDTAEVLSAVDVALERRCPLVVLTAGGELAGRARARGVPRVALPGGLMPRMALGYLFFPALAVLDAADLPIASPDEISEALDVVEGLGAELGCERPAATNEAKRLALAIDGRWPAIYGGPVTGSVAYRWKTDLEENAKALAVAGTVPEMNHNEIEAWRPPGARTMHAVLLRDRHEPEVIARRFALLREIIAPSAGGVSEAWTRGSSRLARLLSLTYLGQWASYYTAVLRETDPWSVPLLDELKRRMRGNVHRA